MSIRNICKALFYLFITVLIGTIIVFNILQETFVIKEYCLYLNQEFINSIKLKIVYEKHIPNNYFTQASRNKTLIYVLGGNEDSLTYRFREASNLYHQGISNKILILSRPGITDYDSDLGRNLTNNEWAIMELEKYNVKKEDIEPVAVHALLFGTLSEAKGLPDIIHKKGYSRLVLVTSTYHTKRTFKVFSKVSRNNSIELFIYRSDENIGIQGLIMEYMKMLLYDNIVLPVYGWE